MDAIEQLNPAIAPATPAGNGALVDAVWVSCRSDVQPDPPTCHTLPSPAHLVETADRSLLGYWLRLDGQLRRCRQRSVPQDQIIRVRQPAQPDDEGNWLCCSNRFRGRDPLDPDSSRPPKAGVPPDGKLSPMPPSSPPLLAPREALLRAARTPLVSPPLLPLPSSLRKRGLPVWSNYSDRGDPRRPPWNSRRASAS